MLRTFVADAQYALRVLYRVPSFAIAVIAVLALGIGANTAIFSIVNTVLLRPLPFDEPDQLVRVFHVPPQNAFPGMARFSVSAGELLRLEAVGAFIRRDGALPVPAVQSDGRRQSRIHAGRRGRTGFLRHRAHAAGVRACVPAEEDCPARSHVVIVSDGFWKTHLAARSDAVGRTLTLDDEAYTIVGVMPARFTSPSWGITSVRCGCLSDTPTPSGPSATITTIRSLRDCVPA